MLIAIMTLKSVDPSDPFCKASGSFVQNIVNANLINKTSTLKFICQLFNLNTLFFSILSNFQRCFLYIITYFYFFLE